MERRRTAPRLAVLLACAAVPAVLLAGCSSGSGGDAEDSGNGSSSAPSGSPTPAVAPARFGALPESCRTASTATVTALVPKAKTPGGSEAESSDASQRIGCSWTGNGKDGYQYRWLSITVQRFTSSAATGSAEDQAKKRYTEQVAELRAAKGFTTSAVTGVGDQASSVSGKATVAKVTSQNDTVVARTGNVVVLVEFDGAGLEGKKNPTAATVNSGALRAAKDAVGAVAAANPGSADGAPGASPTATGTGTGTGELGG